MLVYWRVPSGVCQWRIPPAIGTWENDVPCRKNRGVISLTIPGVSHQVPTSKITLLITHIRAPYLSHIRREKSHHPHGTAAIQKVTSGSGKSHQGRRITMAQPVSSIMMHMPKSGRSIAHNRENGIYPYHLLSLKSYWYGTATMWHIKLYSL